MPTPSGNTDLFTHTQGHLKQLDLKFPPVAGLDLLVPPVANTQTPGPSSTIDTLIFGSSVFLAYFPADGIWCLLVFTYVDIHIHAHCAHLTVFAGAGNRDAWTAMAPGPTLVAVCTPAHRTGSPLPNKIARKEV